MTIQQHAQHIQHLVRAIDALAATENTPAVRSIRHFARALDLELLMILESPVATREAATEAELDAEHAAAARHWRYVK